MTMLTLLDRARSGQRARSSGRSQSWSVGSITGAILSAVRRAIVSAATLSVPQGMEVNRCGIMRASPSSQ